MPSAREIGVMLGLVLTGLFFGALAGAATVAALVFALNLRQGRVEFPVTVFGSVLGALFGGPLGMILTLRLSSGRLSRVPVGRLFTYLTGGTALGGSAAALLIPDPVVALVGGVAGFIWAAKHLVARVSVEPEGADEPRTHAG
jgi:hypothetical protein